MWLGLAVAGCASGEGVNPRGDGGRVDAASGDSGGSGDDAAVDCLPACGAGETCVGGVCHPATEDLDHDGIPSSLDCDDTSASIGSVSEHSCTSSCGTGVEHCQDGVWAACTAPTTCDCTTGEPPRMIACARCGMQRQICTAGVWTDDGLCTGSGPCAPGDMDVGASCGMCGHQARLCQADCTWGAWTCSGEGVCVAGMVDSEDQACGTCGTGTQTRSRTCDATTCQWGTYTSWSACVGGGAGTCMPGQTDTDTQPCGRCNSGHHTRTRSCDSTTCDWGSWGAFGACTGESGCVPGDTRTGCDMNSTGAATSCGVNVCTSSCTWGTACVVAPGASCLSQRGTNYQCCTPSGGGSGWQFCSPTCQWNACASHSC